MTRRRLAACGTVLSGALLLSAGLTAHDGSHNPGTVPSGTKTAVSRAAYRVPDITLLDQDGKAVRLAAALTHDAPVILTFFFTSCRTICPTQTRTLLRATHSLPTGAASPVIVAISNDPDHDNPATLKTYARDQRLDGRWRLLTGTPGDVVRVQQAFHAWRGGKMNHAPLLFLRGSATTAWTRIEGLATTDEILRQYRALPAR